MKIEVISYPILKRVKRSSGQHSKESQIKNSTQMFRPLLIIPSTSQFITKSYEYIFNDYFAVQCNIYDNGAI